MASTRISIERILCPTDFSEFSERALQRALALARWFEARVTVLHAQIVAPRGFPMEGGTYAPVAGDLLRTTREDLLKALDRFVEPHLGEGVPIETELVEGDPPRAIRVAAEAMAADLLVMGTHGRGGFEHLLLGSVTEKLLRAAPCPVLTVGQAKMAPPSDPLFRRILCAADLTKASQRTFDMALSLAEENLAQVTLLHVVEGVLGESDLPLYRPVPETMPLRRTLMEEARDRLETMAHGARAFCEVSGRVETGPAWRQILRVAQESNADLVVMGAHSGGALARMFLGSTANHVVRQAPCPVLVVREMVDRAAHREEVAVERSAVGADSSRVRP